VEDVRGGDEEDLREVVFDVEIVVLEGSPRKSLAILSISSSMMTGFLVPAFFMDWMIWPGRAPM